MKVTAAGRLCLSTNDDATVTSPQGHGQEVDTGYPLFHSSHLESIAHAAGRIADRRVASRGHCSCLRGQH